MDQYAIQIKELTEVIGKLKEEKEELERKKFQEELEVDTKKNHLLFDEKKLVEFKKLHDAILCKSGYFRSQKIMYAKVFLLNSLVGVCMFLLFKLPLSLFLIVNTLFTSMFYILDTHRFRKYIKNKNLEEIKEDIEKLEDDEQRNQKSYDFHRQKRLEYNRQIQEKERLLLNNQEKLENLKGIRSQLIDSLLEELLEQRLEDDFEIQSTDKPYVIKKNRTSLSTEI